MHPETIRAELRALRRSVRALVAAWQRSKP